MVGNHRDSPHLGGTRITATHGRPTCPARGQLAPFSGPALVEGAEVAARADEAVVEVDGFLRTGSVS